MSERDPFENYRKRREIELMEKQFQARAAEQRQRVDDLQAEEDDERTESDSKVEAEMADFLTESVQNAERMIENMCEDGEEGGEAPMRLESQIEDFFASVGGKDAEEARESLPPDASVTPAAAEPPPLREPSPIRTDMKLPPRPVLDAAEEPSPREPEPRHSEVKLPPPPPLNAVEPPLQPPPREEHQHEEPPREEPPHEEPPQPSVVERRPLGGVEEKPKKSIDLNAALDRIRRHVKSPDEAPIGLREVEEQPQQKVRSGNSDFLHRLEGEDGEDEEGEEAGVGGVTNRFQSDPGEDRDIDDDVDAEEPPGWNIPVRPPPPGAWVVAREKEEGQSGLAGAAGDTYLIKKLCQEVRSLNRVYLVLLEKGVVTRDEVEGDGQPTRASDDDDDEGVSVDDLQDERYRPIDTTDQNFSLSALVKDVHRLKMLREVLLKKGIVSQKELEKAKG